MSTLVDALLLERSGYVARGLHERVAEVDRVLATHGVTVPDAPETATPAPPQTAVPDAPETATPPSAAPTDHAAQQRRGRR